MSIQLDLNSDHRAEGKDADHRHSPTKQNKFNIILDLDQGSNFRHWIELSVKKGLIWGLIAQMLEGSQPRFSCEMFISIFW